MRRTLVQLRMPWLAVVVSLAGSAGCEPGDFRKLGEAPGSEGTTFLEVALAGDGSVLASFFRTESGVHATRIVDGSWVSTPDPLTAATTFPVALVPSPSGVVLASLSMVFDSPRTVYFQRWGGTAWESLGEVTLASEAVFAGAGVDGSGRPWVASGMFDTVRFLRQGSAGFDAMPTLGASLSGVAAYSDVRFDGAGRAFYAVGKDLYTLESESSTWAPAAPAVPGATYFPGRLFIDSAGRVLVAIAARDLESALLLRTYRLEAGTWTQLGDAINLGGHGGEMALAVDEQDRPHVLAKAGDALQLHRWDGAAWAQLGAPLQLGAQEWMPGAALALPPGGRPIVIWAQTVTPRIGPFPFFPTPARLYAAEFMGE